MALRGGVRVGYFAVTGTFVVTDQKMGDDGPELEFSREEWAEFIKAVKGGAFDDWRLDPDAP